VKKQEKERILGIGICILALTSFLTTPIRTRPVNTEPLTVVLDPGHGGADGGAIGDDGTLEKDLNLKIALLLKTKLEERGIMVLLTRTADEDTDGLTGFHKRQDLERRAALGNESGANLYISIHVNASPARKDQGFQVWYGSGNIDGQLLADKITQSVEELKICTRIRAVKQVPETLYIFRTVMIPCVLVECGFISNAADRYKLQQDEFQDQLCNGIRDGILNYASGNSSEIT